MINIHLPDDIDINLYDLCSFFSERGYNLMQSDKEPGTLVPMPLGFSPARTPIEAPARTTLTLIQGGKDGTAN